MLFTTAPVLVQSDPALQFVVQVDASDIGVGAVLCQRRGPDARLHPSAFFSCRLSPAEANYNVGNRELLVVTAKRLNSHQAGWALFFSRFEFILTYCPGSCNIKPDYLSRQFSVEEKVQEDGNILPTSKVIAALTWDIENAILQAQQHQPDPGQRPPGRMFVPDAVHSQVLQWAHSSKLSCHPGINRMLDLIKHHFWWRNMKADIKSFVQACTVCARRKALPSTTVRPPPAPFCSWAALVPHRPGFCLWFAPVQ
ncbi:hypothetical protein L3Q82_001014 [Scortum barcoo]|uniref:Uncharacterized protein n=1 Tax=Scortum barcoo TaxID=214431 RepID=A0ACB8WA93_9TELE|nr:hypothetical protein L3Q82_001014 [Scortum barcoo]